MSHRDLLIESGERRSHRRRGIAVHQHAVGLVVCDHVVHAAQHARRQGAEALIVLHDIEAEVRLEIEQIEHLRDHLLVLAGRADGHGESRRCLQATDERRHLDGLGPRADDGEDLSRWHCDLPQTPDMDGKSRGLPIPHPI